MVQLAGDDVAIVRKPAQPSKRHVRQAKPLARRTGRVVQDPFLQARCSKKLRPIWGKLQRAGAKFSRRHLTEFMGLIPSKRVDPQLSAATEDDGLSIRVHTDVLNIGEL